MLRSRQRRLRRAARGGNPALHSFKGRFFHRLSASSRALDWLTPRVDGRRTDSLRLRLPESAAAGGPIEQAELSLVMLFALLRSAQGLQLVVLTGVPVAAGTRGWVVTAVATALTLETAVVVGRALVRRSYGSHRTAWTEISMMLLAFASVHAATPPASQVEASSWLFSPAIVLVCGTALALKARALLVGALLVDLAYAWGSLHAPSGTSPLLFNLGSITAFPVLAAVSLIMTRFIRRIGERLRDSERSLAAEAEARARLEERARQGRFLHDSVIQVLEEVRERLGGGAHAALVQEAADAARQCRLYLAGKDPLATDSVTTLLRGLQAHADELELRLRIIDDQAVGHEPDIDSTQLSALNLVAREALRNIRKHSGERTVTLRLVADEASLRLTVGRSGQGYDASRLAPDKFGAIRDVGGSVHVDTVHAPDYGERLTFSVPGRSAAP